MNFSFTPQESTLTTDAHTHSQQSLQRPTAPSPQRHPAAPRCLGAAISAAASPASTQSFSETEPETPEQGLA